MTRHIAIATCQQLPDGDPEEQPLLDALAELGLAVSLVPWTAPEVDWAGFDATVVRSTWDYTGQLPQFLAWADSVPRLHNPAGVIRSNSDKRYLAGLAAAGLPVVPTGFFEPGQPVRLPDSGEFVVKPSVGAGSRGAGRFDADRPGGTELAGAHARALHGAGRTVLVQPYLSGVDAAGETALVFIDGRFSHAIGKAAMLAPGSQHPIAAEHLYVAETITSRRPGAGELEVAGRVLDQLSQDLARPLLYARIDLLPGESGPVLVEAELTEPSLFLTHCPAAGMRLARAICDRTA
ncbi:MAG: ATP-grasp domain-containing protein [Jatrophihabitans sp.]